MPREALRNAREEFIERWSPLVGVDAARLQRRAMTLGRLMLLAILPAFLCFVLYESTKSAIALALAVTAVSVAAVLFVCMMIVLHQSFRFMSSYFGIRVWVLNAPSFRQPGFQKWCEKNGVQPQP
jgi:hypothetical protein